MISVLTCAARGRYLAASIASIDRAGGAAYAGRKVIHVDGPEHELYRHEGWEISTVAPIRRGARHAMLEIMRRAAASDVELLLYFEDDVLLCKNAITFMTALGVPEPLGFVSYCDLSWHGVAGQLVAMPGCPRNMPVPDGGFVGCQALAIPRRTIESLISTPAPTWLDRNNCDGTIGTCADSYGVLDSLADHVGSESCIMNATYDRLRVVRGWRGENFDALTLPRTFVLNDLGERCAMHGGVLHDPPVACAGSSSTHAACTVAAVAD